ncbi:MAG: PEP-CTERM sorting domain-containing protein [Phycisphaerales bacterium JB063]
MGTTFAACTLGLMATASPVTVSSYSYDNAGDYNGQAGKDDAAATAQALTDGLGLAGSYTPSTFFWEPGQEGTIYNNFDTSILAGEGLPSITFDFGSVQSFQSVYIHYGVRSASGIVSAENVEVIVDGTSIGTFSGFDTSPSVDNFGDIRVFGFDVGAQSGQSVQLIMTGGTDPNPVFDQTWHGLTEVVFDTEAVPEPGSLALLGLGGMAMLRRRRA